MCNINNEIWKSKINLLLCICVLSYSSGVCISAYANVYFKTILKCPRSIARVPFDLVRRFWATLLLRTTCMRLCWTWVASCVLLCFIDPRVRKIRNEASSCPGIFSRTLRFYYVASSPGSPLPYLLERHRKLVGYSAIPARSYPGPVRYHWGSIVELEVPPDETPGLRTLHPHNTNVLQSITYAKSPYPPNRSNSGQKNWCFRHDYG